MNDLESAARPNQNGRGAVLLMATAALAGLALAMWPRRTHAAKKTSEMVVTYHPEATQAGLSVLRAGGNAFDAFIAATMAEYVVAEGGTSLAGPLAVLTYDAKKRELQYLDAEFNALRHRKGQWKAGDPKGKAILPPGAPAGLEALSRRYGKLPFGECLQPAIKLARDGFKLNEFYGYMLALSAKVLRANDYGRETFFRRGMPLEAGDVLRQPELASVLTGLAQHGASYMYTGDWATRFLKAAQAHGGLVAPSDLSGYKAIWREPWQASYRGYTIHASSGTSFGGPWCLLALKTLEHTNLAPLGHPSRSPGALELVLRTARQVWSEPWIFDYRRLQDRKFVGSRLTPEYTAGIWHRVQKEAGASAVPKAGSHSYHIIVVDKDGNVASGTNTHESLGWCDGLFVDGVLLPSSGYLPWSIRPGERRLSPFTMHMVLKDDSIRFVTGSFSTGILEASLQFLVNLIDYQLPTREAASLPRFGTFPNSPDAFMSAEGASKDPTLKVESNVLDSRIGSDFAAALEDRGLNVVPDSAQRRWEERECERLSKEGFACTRTPVDTGMGTLVAIRADGSTEGATAPWPGVTSPLREVASPGGAGRSR